MRFLASSVVVFVCGRGGCPHVVGFHINDIVALVVRKGGGIVLGVVRSGVDLVQRGRQEPDIRDVVRRPVRRIGGCGIPAHCMCYSMCVVCRLGMAGSK